MSTCAACGKDNPSEAVFCLACGTALEEESSRAETRKTVSVVFADVTGSTALGEQLDPEALRQVMGRYFAEARAALEHHGGTVEKFIGDAVVAVFGIPQRHEDDAVRAVRAAAELRDRVRSLSAELEASAGLRLEIRTGVNTGEVVTGDLAEGASFASGDAMNVAARLEQAAEPGEILLGEPTYMLVRDAVRVEPSGSLTLKGKTKPVPAWRLIAVDPSLPGLARRLDAPLLGREAELGLLEEAFANTVDQPCCELVTVFGQAGIGKSRLTREFLSDLEDRATVLRGRCLPYGEGVTFWPLAEALRAATGIVDDDSSVDARSKIRAMLANPDDDAERELIVERVAGALGLQAEAAEAVQETFLALRRLFEALARVRPLVLVFDDIHWAEPTFLDFLEYLAGWTRGVPLLVLCVSRPELAELRPGWSTPSEFRRSITLGPFSEEQSSRLIANLLSGSELDEAVAARISSAAEGNPLYLEEFVRMLRDEGLLRRDNGRTVVQGDLASLPLPASIEGVLAARLDRLDAAERGVIERASVIGKIFWWGAVAALSPEAVRPSVGSHLQTLVRREFLLPDASTFAGEDGFRFSHILVRDAAYGSISKLSRARLHAAFADWLLGAVGERVVEYEEIVGYHLEQAYRCQKELGRGDARTLELGESASTRLASAGRRAAQRADMHAAALLLERAADLAPGGEALELNVLLDLGDCLIEVGDFTRAEAVLNSVRKGAESLRDRRLQARATLMASWLQLHVHPSSWRRAIEAEVEGAIEVLEEFRDDVGLGQAFWLEGHLQWLDLQAAPTEVALERALLHAKSGAMEREEARILARAAAAAFLGPRKVGAAVARCEKLLKQARGNPLAVASILLATGALRAMEGDTAGGRVDAEQAKRMVQELDLPLAVGEAGQFSGMIEMIAGDFARAESEFRFSCEVLAEMGERSLLSTSAGLLAAALCNQARYAEALEPTYVAERDGAEDDLATQELWRISRARCLAHDGDCQSAERLAHEGVALIAESDFLNMRADALVGQGEVLTLAGKRDDAEAALTCAVQLYEEKGNRVSAERAHALIHGSR
jgi:class 3 adenylate cyclase/tetratricopeptide (TPR) repeat protein